MTDEAREMSKPTNINAFSYEIKLLAPSGLVTKIGAFAEVDGLVATSAAILKIRGLRKFTNITLKRGVVDSSGLSDWLAGIGAHGSYSEHNAILTWLDPADHPIRSWRLVKAKPGRYTGPPLPGRRTSVQIAELVLSAEAIEPVPHS